MLCVCEICVPIVLKKVGEVQELVPKTSNRFSETQILIPNGVKLVY